MLSLTAKHLRRSSVLKHLQPHRSLSYIWNFVQSLSFLRQSHMHDVCSSTNTNSLLISCSLLLFIGIRDFATCKSIETERYIGHSQSNYVKLLLIISRCHTSNMICCVVLGWHDSKLLWQQPPHRFTRVHDGNIRIDGSLVSFSSSNLSGTTVISGLHRAITGCFDRLRSTFSTPNRPEDWKTKIIIDQCYLWLCQSFQIVSPCERWTLKMFWKISSTVAVIVPIVCNRIYRRIVVWNGLAARFAARRKSSDIIDTKFGRNMSITLSRQPHAIRSKRNRHIYKRK